MKSRVNDGQDSAFSLPPNSPSITPHHYSPFVECQIHEYMFQLKIWLSIDPRPSFERSTACLAAIESRYRDKSLLSGKVLGQHENGDTSTYSEPLDAALLLQAQINNRTYPPTLPYFLIAL